MTRPVDLNKLESTLVDFAYAYLVTVGDDFSSHAVTVDTHLLDGSIAVSPLGNRTNRNASQHHNVTLLYPPREPGGYTLIIDGRFEPTNANAGKVTPTRAVLHRPAAADAPTTAAGCLHDCVPLEA